jgi:hypothetical protein
LRGMVAATGHRPQATGQRPPGKAGGQIGAVQMGIARRKGACALRRRPSPPARLGRPLRPET